MNERRPLVYRIVTRILLLNVLIVFLPVVSMLLLDTYEEQLLEALERSLVQQGRVLAAALAVSPELDASTAERLLRALRGRHEARLRILDGDGQLLADSSTLEMTDDAAAGEDVAVQPADDDPIAPRETLLYRVASFPVRFVRDRVGGPQTPLPSADFYSRTDYASGAEVRAALDGRYGASTRVSAGGQISVTLYSALPVEHEGRVAGAVLVSQSTFRILQDLYQIRIDVFTIFLWCLAAAVVLSIFLALTIARPIAVLGQRAREAVDERGRLRGPLPPQRRRDEIGALSRSLSDLTSQIVRYTRRLEGFAADASHELKNPLASIGASCEMALDARNEGDRSRFLRRARTDVKRAESIIAAMRELTQIDAQTDPPAACRPSDALASMIRDLDHRYATHAVALENEAEHRSDEVPISNERLYQVVENLVSNATSFAPAGSTITVTLETGERRRQLVLGVRDEGPGFEEPTRAFDRFYSSRDERDGHLGLGLSIVKSIAETAGGSVEAANASGGGACVTVVLPTV